jgi:outer membrane biosynthesis protein TonB
MKLVGVISTAVLSLALGVAVPGFAQDREQEEQKAKPAQEEKKAQPEKPAKQEQKSAQAEKDARQENNAKQEQKNVKPEENNAKQQEKNTRPEEKNAQPERNTKAEQNMARPEQPAAGNRDRIPAERYKASFGREHSFRVSEGDYRNHRFEYGGYSFGFVDPWPSNWLYTQNVYVVEIDGVYYLCNPTYPGVNLVLSFSL